MATPLGVATNRLATTMALPLLRLLARTILLIAAGFALWAVLPLLWGWHASTVMSNSMAPSIRAGDVVVTMPQPAAALRVGQVLLADDPDHPGRTRLHRLVGLDGDALITKGDANPHPDSSLLHRQTVHGVGITRIPWLGYPAVWLQRGGGVPLAASAAALLGLGSLAAGPIEPRVRQRRRGPVLRATIGTAAAVLAAFAVAAPASPSSWAAFASSTSAEGTGFVATETFDCLSRAPLTPAFLHYRFGEPAGTVVLDSSGNGRNGTIHGGATRVPGSCAAGDGPALTLDGSSGIVSTPTALMAPAEFTIELWVRTTTAVGGRLVGFGSSQTSSSATTDRLLYLTDAGRVVFGVAAGARVTVASTAAVNDGAWHLIDATLATNGAMKLFVDGVAVASRGAVAGVIAYPGYWRIGTDTLLGWPDAPTHSGAAATVDEVTVYSTSLNPAQVSSDHAAGR
ncbi:MAG TPA: LamG-like jellyroll fold domain-containing protein [Cellulomonas sp.]